MRSITSRTSAGAAVTFTPRGSDAASGFGLARLRACDARDQPQRRPGEAPSPRPGGRRHPGAGPRRRRTRRASARPRSTRPDAGRARAWRSRTHRRGDRAPARARPGSSPGSPATIASAASRAETNASYIPSPESGSTRPAASPTRRTRSLAGRRGADAAHREPVAAEVGDRVRVDPVGAREPREVPAQAAAPRSPSLRRRGSRDRPSGRASRSRRPGAPISTTAVDAKRSLVEQRPGDVPLERDAALDAGVEPGRLRDDAVRAVGADEDVGRDALAADGRRDAVLADRDLLDPRAVPEARARRRPPARRGMRRAGGAGSSGSAARALVRRKLRRWCRRSSNVSTTRSTTGVMSHGTCRSARPVTPPPHALSRGNRARSARSTLAPLAGEMDRGRRSRRPGADDEDVDAAGRSSRRALVGLGATANDRCSGSAGEGVGGRDPDHDRGGVVRVAELANAPLGVGAVDEDVEAGVEPRDVDVLPVEEARVAIRVADRRSLVDPAGIRLTRRAVADEPRRARERCPGRRIACPQRSRRQKPLLRSRRRTALSEIGCSS